MDENTRDSTRTLTPSNLTTDASHPAPTKTPEEHIREAEETLKTNPKNAFGRTRRAMALAALAHGRKRRRQARETIVKRQTKLYEFSLWNGRVSDEWVAAADAIARRHGARVVTCEGDGFCLGWFAARDLGLLPNGATAVAVGDDLRTAGLWLDGPLPSPPRP